VEDRKRSQQVQQEIAIIVRVVLPSDPVELSPLDEIQGLAETAGAIVVGGMVQRRDKPDNTAYLGKGKVAELANLRIATSGRIGSTGIFTAPTKTDVDSPFKNENGRRHAWPG